MFCPKPQFGGRCRSALLYKPTLSRPVYAIDPAHSLRPRLVVGDIFILTACCRSFWCSLCRLLFVRTSLGLACLYRYFEPSRITYSITTYLQSLLFIHLASTQSLSSKQASIKNISVQFLQIRGSATVTLTFVH